jgi:hypothetical protein
MARRPMSEVTARDDGEADAAAAVVAPIGSESASPNTSASAVRSVMNATRASTCSLFAMRFSTRGTCGDGRLTLGARCDTESELRERAASLEHASEFRTLPRTNDRVAGASP